MRLRGAALAAVALSALLAPTVGPAQPAVTTRAALDELSTATRELGGLRLVQAQADPSRLAALEIRLSRLEEELRRLTGRLEELEYADRQAQARIDKLIADLDLRLRGGEAVPPALAETPSPPATADEPPTAMLPEEDADLGAVEPPRPDAAAKQGFVLGRIDPGALERPPPPATVPDTPKGHYDAALDLLQRGDFARARAELETFLRQYPDDSLAPAAAYWLAETYFVEGDADQAAALFARNYQSYGPEAPRAAENLLKMGLALTQIGKRAEACQTFSELERRHPNAPAPVKQAAVRGKVGAGCTG
jgi:tol-pal system protein YbgF